MPAPGKDVLKFMASAPPAFVAWLEEEYDAACRKTISCDDANNVRILQGTARILSELLSLFSSARRNIEIMEKERLPFE